MKILADQDVYAKTVQFLVALGHDLATAADRGLSQAEDLQLLHVARSEQRILVTRDKDFGNLVFAGGAGSGVVFLRMLPSTVDQVHTELQNVLNQYREDELLAAFVVVEPGRHRFRKLSP